MITVTCASTQEARKISSRLLAKRLIACANIIPNIESKFWWKGKLEKSKEALVMMKTIKTNFKKIETEVRRIHSYEVPEIIALPIMEGSKPYLSWIKDSLK